MKDGATNHNERLPWVVAPKAMVRGPSGRYLFIRRSSRCTYFAGRWEMPGGKPDPGETLDQCLVRETREETGLEIRIEGILGTAEAAIDTLNLAYMIMGAVSGSEEVVLSREHDRFAWVTPEEALALDVCAAFRPFLQTLAAIE